MADGLLVSAAPMMEGGYTILLTVVDAEGRCRHFTHPCTGFPQDCALAAQDGGSVAMVWNEIEKEQWHIRYLCLDPAGCSVRPVSPIVSSPSLLLPPAVAATPAGLIAAWPALNGQHLRIQTARFEKEVWTVQNWASAQGGDAHRPALSVAGEHVFLAWDEFRKGRYETVLNALEADGVCRELHRMGSGETRWMGPALAAVSPEEVHLVAVGLRTVTDALGIVDRHAFAAAGVWNGHTFLEGPDPAIDFSDGLLSDKVYKGYLGWRRRPQLAVIDNGRVLLAWEHRPESAGSAVDGCLLGRIVRPDGTCAEIRRIMTGRYGYTLPPRCPADHVAAAHFHFQARGRAIVGGSRVSMNHAAPNGPLKGKPKRWNRAFRPRPETERFTAQWDEEPYTLYWADTHCHTHFSPDAEGDLDELIHFARDIAGLDAVCLIDNDYYPHKGLLDAEWRVHQDLSRHYTQPGRFVFFPGYEFTFHDAALTPHFNHRCVVFREAGGRLVRRIDPGIRNEKDLYAALGDTPPVLCYPHHCTYRLSDPLRERGVEVVSSWRVCLEETDFTLRQLKDGRVFGFIGSSDTHRCVPGLGGALTGIWARELTPAGLFEAYAARRLMATQGARIGIDFRINGHPMGTCLRVNGAATFQARIAAPEAIAYAEILRNGEVIYREDVHACKASFTHDETSPTERTFYFLRVKLEGETSFNTPPEQNNPCPFTNKSSYPHNLGKARGCFAWSSPIWVNR